MNQESDKRYSLFLFPTYFRKAGYLFCLAGIVAACLIYILDVKPDFLDIKVFAIFSYYFKKKYMAIVNNNISEEILMLLFILGLYMISFSKFNNETMDTLSIRLKAMFISVYLNTIILIIAVIFTYGLGFIAFAVANCFSFLLLNTIVLGILMLARKTKVVPDGSLQ